jgi:threonine aldolase
MAALLAERVAGVGGVRISRPVQANAVFATLPPELADVVREQFPFYTWDASTGEVRWMCSWDTTEDDVQQFAAALESAAAVAQR